MFGVEVGEKFDIKSESYGKIKNCFFGELVGMLHVPDENDDKDYFKRALLLTELITGEAKIIKNTQPILDDVEKDYLKNIVKPFKVKSIVKLYDDRDNSYYIRIVLNNESSIFLPSFSIKSKMYKGMRPGEDYILEELGIGE